MGDKKDVVQCKKKNKNISKQGMKAKAFCGATLVSEAYVKCYNISLISAY